MLQKKFNSELFMRETLLEHMKFELDQLGKCAETWDSMRKTSKPARFVRLMPVGGAKEEDAQP